MNLPLPPPPPPAALPAEPPIDHVADFLGTLKKFLIGSAIGTVGLAVLAASNAEKLNEWSLENAREARERCLEKTDELNQTMLRRRFGNASLSQLKWDTAGVMYACK